MNDQIKIELKEKIGKEVIKVLLLRTTISGKASTSYGAKTPYEIGQIIEGIIESIKLNSNV